jgi:hypothetical protein
MPALQKIAAAHADEVNVVGVVWDSVDDETLRGFLDSLGVGYDVVRLQRQHRHDWGGMAVLPTTFLVGRDGKVLRRYVGATDEQIAGLSVDVDAVLAGKSMPAMVVPEVGNGVTDEDRPRKPHTP